MTLAMLVFAGACGQPGTVAGGASAVATQDRGPEVARAGDVTIHAAEVREHAAGIGADPRRATDDLLALQLLAEKARESGVTPPEPEKALLVERLIQREFEASHRPEDIPDATLRSAYERVKNNFVHPRLVEVFVIAIYTGPHLKGPARTEREGWAKMLADRLATNKPTTLDAFVDIARDPAFGGKVGALRRWQSEDAPFPPVVGAAVMKLSREGQMTPIVSDESGYYVAWYLAEKAPKNVAFAEAREEIRTKLYPSWRKERFLHFASGLAAKWKVEAHPSRVR